MVLLSPLYDCFSVGFLLVIQRPIKERCSSSDDDSHSPIELSVFMSSESKRTGEALWSCGTAAV